MIIILTCALLATIMLRISRFLRVTCVTLRLKLLSAQDISWGHLIGIHLIGIHLIGIHIWIIMDSGRKRNVSLFFLSFFIRICGSKWETQFPRYSLWRLFYICIERDTHVVEMILLFIKILIVSNISYSRLVYV